MIKKILIVSIYALLLMHSGQGDASLSRLFNPPAEQVEDFSYYQQYNWDSPVERTALYEAIANGQLHMYEKMRSCQGRTGELDIWLKAFKSGAKEVAYTESDFLMRDMDDNQLHDPEDRFLVILWMLRNFAEAHFKGYTGQKLRQLQNKFWGHCLAELPVELFTQEALDQYDDKRRREADRGMSYR